ncbi:sugar isomerase domain-containing protein [Pseudactinotalea sp. Z1748]|uniref:sugar isomerase domain-containing protein n=1 Tax=Pseudactinotalea sp. Z1748 TaxID=3413027 RepID=UPI003C7A4347
MTVINQTIAASAIMSAVTRVLTTQTVNIRAAAEVYVRALDAGGIIQAFGTGHSRGFAMEVAGRAGGLVPANQLNVKDVVMYGDTDPADIMTPDAERRPETAHAVLDLAELHPADAFIIASNSGGNGATVEMAVQARRRGHQVIAVTSMDHTTQITSRHPSGRRLFEVADVVIDNGSVFGDAEVEIPGVGAAVPSSAVTANMIAEMIAAEVCGIMLDRGDTPPILVSANVPGGDEHNDAIRARYGTRLRVGEP